MKSRRRAAARVYFAAFGMLNTVVNHLLSFDEANDGWAETFTPEERAYMRNLNKRLHDNGELCRKFAWRLQKS